MAHDPFAGAPGYREPQLHPDHRAAGAAALDAIYVRATAPLYYPAHAAEGLAPYRVGEILLIMRRLYRPHRGHLWNLRAKGACRTRPCKSVRQAVGL